MQIDGLDAEDLEIFIAEFLAPFPPLSPTTALGRERSRARWVVGGGGRVGGQHVRIAFDVTKFGSFGGSGEGGSKKKYRQSGQSVKGEGTP